MKKSASTILCSGLFISALSGCAQPLETPGNESAYRTAITQLEPVTVPSEIYKAFNEQGQQLLLKDFSDVSLIPEGMLYTGTLQLPDIELTSYSGEIYNLKDFSGKNTVLELVGDWCSHCRAEMKELPELVRNNPEITFIQIFVEGSRNKVESDDEDMKESTVDTIQSFYEASDTDIDPAQVKDWLILQENEDIQYWALENGLSVFPTFMFFDDSGVLSWIHEGKLTQDKFSQLKSNIFGDDLRIYDSENLNGFESPFDALRDEESVRSDLPNDVFDQIMDTLDQNELAVISYFSNIAKTINLDTELKDTNGKPITPVTYEKPIILVFLDETRSTVDSDIQALSTFAEKYPDIAILNLLLRKSENHSAVVEMLPGFVVDDMSSIPDSFNNVTIYDTPLICIVDPGLQKIVSVNAGDLSLEKIEKTLLLWN